jgi:hypothetical protein
LHWNVPGIWRELTHDESPEGPQALEGARAWLVWRQQLTLFCRPLDADEAWSLDAVHHGADFAGLCDGLCRWIDPENVAVRAAGHLRQWIADGLIAQLRT